MYNEEEMKAYIKDLNDAIEQIEVINGMFSECDFDISKMEDAIQRVKDKIVIKP